MSVIEPMVRPFFEAARLGKDERLPAFLRRNALFSHRVEAKADVKILGGHTTIIRCIFKCMFSCIFLLVEAISTQCLKSQLY